jgi:TonB family protein
MNHGNVEPTRWTRRRWLLGFGAIFLLHVLLVVFFAEDPAVEPRRPEQGTVFKSIVGTRMNWDITEALGTRDPTLFALVNRHGFSGEIWNKRHPLEHELWTWQETPPWWTNAANELGNEFSRFVQSNSIPPVQFPFPEGPWIPRLNVKRELPHPESTLELQGDPARRELLSPVDLPAWPHGELLTNTVVQIKVNPEGHVFSAVLLGSSGFDKADQYALEVARNAKFTPLEPQGADRPDAPAVPSFGKMIFRWHTVPSQSSQDTSAQP